MTAVSNLAVVCIEPRKKWFAKQLRLYGIVDETLEEDDVDDIEEEENEVEVEVEEVDTEEYLKSLDPRNWKDQDHYAILGLKNKRVAATEEEIRRNYRKKILVHHPDKRGGVIDTENDYFACITKAFETLGDPTKRRSYDSIDPNFDDDIPSKLSASKAKTSFISKFGPVFKANARWSVKQPVPLLGNMKSSRQVVDKFYSFWYDFDSWREYSYLDEEDKERGQDRDERRWIEKENRAARQKRKKEEMTRIRELVDNAYASDPRIARFKEEEKQKKLDIKKAKEDARKAKLDEEARIKKEQEDRERSEKQAEEEALKTKREQEKKEKEALKKKKRKVRKDLEQFFDNFESLSSNINEKVRYLEDFDKICMTFSLLELEDFRRAVENVDKIEDKKQVFEKHFRKLSSNNGSQSTVSPQNQNISKTKPSANDSSSKVWSFEDCQLLTKAVNLFPAGTADRWEVIAEYLKQHSKSNTVRKARDVLSKAKDLQKLDPSVKREANNNAYKELQDIAAPEVTAEPSERIDAPGDLPWSDEEQQLLEQAMKTFPATLSDRWDKVAECIQTRSKKEVIQRVKELVQQSKAKKAALEAAKQKLIK